VSLRDSPFSDVKVPLAWTAALALVVLLVAGIALLVSDRRETFEAQAYGAAKSSLDSVAAPVSGALSQPVRWTESGVSGIRGYFFAVSENRKLKAELREMQRWRDAALALQDTNERLSRVLQLKTDPPVPMVTGRAVSDSRGPFSNSRLINVGREKGVEIGNPVMSENGLVGRVVGVTSGASRVLMVTDIASRVPVMVDRTNARAIMTGDGGPNPKLAYLRGDNPVKAGDRIVTSGDGGVFPRGLPVGVATRGLDGNWRVQLAADYAPIDWWPRLRPSPIPKPRSAPRPMRPLQRRPHPPRRPRPRRRRPGLCRARRRSLLRRSPRRPPQRRPRPRPSLRLRRLRRRRRRPPPRLTPSRRVLRRLPRQRLPAESSCPFPRRRGRGLIRRGPCERL
jgi:rod shape-determining protein MreC